MHYKVELIVSAKSIDPGQPAQFAQADLFDTFCHSSVSGLSKKQSTSWHGCLLEMDFNGA